jgi:hypothetical protein
VSENKALRGYLDPRARSRKVAGSRPVEANECFLIYVILPTALGLVVVRNEYQKQNNNVPGE